MASLDQAEEWLKQPTKYEQERGIVTVGFNLARDDGQIRYYFINKSDGTITLGLAISTGPDNWAACRITSLQVLSLLTSLPDLLCIVEHHNWRIKKERWESG